MKNIYLIYIILPFVIFLGIRCSSKEFMNKNIDCKFEKKIDTLLSDVLKKEYVFVQANDIHFNHKEDTNKFNYILSNEIIKKGKVYYRFDSIPIYSVDKDSILSLYKEESRIGVIILWDIHFNNDTTIIKFNVDYAPIYSKGYALTRFTYSLDSINCNWKLIDSSRAVY